VGRPPAKHNFFFKRLAWALPRRGWQTFRPVVSCTSFESYKQLAAMTTTALATLYQELAPCTGLDLSMLLPGGIQREVGHFNVFNLADLWETTQLRPGTSYPCRSFYKISLLRSHSPRRVRRANH
jgi:hypothetical protein